MVQSKNLYYNVNISINKKMFTPYTKVPKESRRNVVPPFRPRRRSSAAFQGLCCMTMNTMNTRQTPKYSTEHEPVNTRAT